MSETQPSSSPAPHGVNKQKLLAAMNAFHESLSIDSPSNSDDDVERNVEGNMGQSKYGNIENGTVDDVMPKETKGMKKKSSVVRFTPGTSAWALLLCLYMYSDKFNGEMRKSEIIKYLGKLAEVSRSFYNELVEEIRAMKTNSRIAFEKTHLIHQPIS